MKFIVTKKRTISFVLVIIMVAITLLLCVKNSGAYVVFFNSTPRKLPIYSVETQSKKIAISFDCAWGTDYTDKILENLKKFDIKCTFFMVEFWTKKYPDYVKKIDDSGHEIGTHSATHSHMSKQEKTKIKLELESSAKAIKEITKKEVKLFRAPYGDYNDRLIQESNALGFNVIQWDVDSLDWKDYSAEKISMRIINKVKNGSIILCHNNGLHTAEALPIIFADLKNKGYKFVTIGELIYSDNFYIDSNGRQMQKTQ